MATEADVRIALRNLLAALGRDQEPEEQVVSTWTRMLRSVEPRKLLLATDELVKRVERMPTIAMVLKAVSEVKEPERPAPACPDCMGGTRTGFYRVTLDEYDDAGRWVGRRQHQAEIVTACLCEAGQRYWASLGRCDQWQAFRQAQVKAQTSEDIEAGRPPDVVWLSDRHQVLVPWEFLHPGQARPGLPSTSIFHPKHLAGQGEETPRVPVERSWYESERDAQ